jgi:hypothetical protein
MGEFKGYHLSSYRTDDPTLAGKLLDDAIRQTQFWLNKLGFSAEQKQQTLILSRTTPRTKNEKGEFTVLALVPLTEEKPDFKPIWDGLLSLTMGEDITFKLEKKGVEQD